MQIFAEKKKDTSWKSQSAILKKITMNLMVRSLELSILAIWTQFIMWWY